MNENGLVGSAVFTVLAISYTRDVGYKRHFPGPFSVSWNENFLYVFTAAQQPQVSLITVQFLVKKKSIVAMRMIFCKAKCKIRKLANIHVLQCSRKTAK